MNHQAIQPIKLAFRTIYFEFETGFISMPHKKTQKFLLRNESGSEELVELERDDPIGFWVKYKNGVEDLISLKRKDIQLTSGQEITMLRIGRKVIWGNKLFSDVVLIDPIAKRHYYLTDLENFSVEWIWDDLGVLTLIPILATILVAAGVGFWYSESVFGAIAVGTLSCFPAVLIIGILLLGVKKVLDGLILKPLVIIHASRVREHASLLVREFLSSKDISEDISGRVS